MNKATRVAIHHTHVAICNVIRDAATGIPAYVISREAIGDDAIRVVTRAATFGATRAATDAAIRDAIDEATPRRLRKKGPAMDKATRIAIDAATDDATGDATAGKEEQ